VSTRNPNIINLLALPLDHKIFELDSDLDADFDKSPFNKSVNQSIRFLSIHSKVCSCVLPYEYKQTKMTFIYFDFIFRS